MLVARRYSCRHPLASSNKKQMSQYIIILYIYISTYYYIILYYILYIYYIYTYMYIQYAILYEYMNMNINMSNNIYNIHIYKI